MKQSTKLAIAALAAIGVSTSSASVAATQWVDIACGNDNSFILDDKGNLWATGFGATGGLGFQIFGPRSFQTSIPSWRKTNTQIKTVSATTLSTLAIFKNSTLIGAGGSGMGVFGISKSAGKHWVALRKNVVATDIQGFHSILLQADGSVWTTGIGVSGELGNGVDLGTVDFNNPTRKVTQWTRVLDNARAVAVYTSSSAAITKNGVLMVTGEIGGLLTSTWTPITDNIQSLSKGTELFAIDKNGNLLSFSASTTAPNGVIWQIEMSGIRSVASNAKQTFAVTSQGELFGRGDNSEGELGVGDAKPRTDWTPVLDQVSKVTACTNHSLVLRTNGEIWATGDNSQGQFGDPGIPSSLAWVRIK